MPGDALPLLDEPKAGRLTIQYSPLAQTEVTENPPRFTWLPVVEDEARYILRLSTDEGFSEDNTQTFSDLPLNFFTPSKALAPGTYHWSYATWANGVQTSTWSSTRSFNVGGSLPETPLKPRAARLEGASSDHPRLWMTPTTTKHTQHKEHTV